jgi:iron complex outermembrane receptor protein
VKTRMGGVTFNGAVFYTDIKNLQTTLDAGSCSSRVVFNVPKAHTKGVEGELTARLAPGFDLGVSGSLLEAEFDSTVRDGTGAVIGGIREGNRLPSVPKFQISINATYTRTLTDDDGRLRHRLVPARRQPLHPGQRPGEQSALVRLGPAVRRGHGQRRHGAGPAAAQLRDLVNLSAGLQMDSGLDIIAYVNNLFDENPLLSFDRERGGRARLGYFDRPAAHDRRDDPQVVLGAGTIPWGGGRETGRPFSMGRAAWPRPGASAWRWIIFQSPSSRRKISVIRRCISTG